MKVKSVFFTVMMLTANACSLFTLKPLEKNIIENRVISIGEDITIESVGSVSINRSEFLPAASIITTNGKKIYIDPVTITSSEKAKLILISHGHKDHFSIKDISKLMGPETIILAPEKIVGTLRKHGYSTEAAVPGDTILAGDLTIEVIPSYNTGNAILFFKAHPRSVQNAGYVITFKNGTRLYYPGDSNLIPEMTGLSNIDILLIPLGDGKLTMDLNEALELINLLKPELVFPVHYLLKTDLTDLEQKLPSESKLIFLQ